MFRRLLKSLFPEKLYVFPDLPQACSAIPNQKAIRVSAGDDELCITREGEKFYAFLNKCPHRQLPLHQGMMENHSWVCPFHRYCFDLDSGKNMTVAHKEPLKFYKTGIDKKGLYIILK